MNQKDLAVAIKKGLKYLENKQRPDGGFISVSAPDQALTHPKYQYATTFTPSLILGALSQSKEQAALTIRAKLAHFLLGQKSELWSFNYWVRQSKEAKTMPYPDDLDDTFCALSGLHLHDPSLIDEGALVQAVKLLLMTESQVGGPYQTWLVSAKSPAVWHDVDLAVNANIAYFLSQTSNPLPNLTAMMEAALQQDTFRSPYYPHDYPVMYYIARAYQGSEKTTLVKLLRKRQHTNGGWGTPLRTALALTSLLRLGEKDERAVRFLLRHQKPDGSWEKEAFCLDPKRDGQTFYSGASSLTTAFALEALSLSQAKPAPLKLRKSLQQSDHHTLKERVISCAETELKQLGRPLARRALEQLRNTAEGRNGEEIILLPHLFYQSLRTQPRLDEELFVTLGLANLYGWMAYTIYDDFLDDEGQPQYLSVANIALRRSLLALQRAIPNNPDFWQRAQATFDIIDAANTWEVMRCRFPVHDDMITIGKLPHYQKLDRLAERSLGHILGPIGILAAAGVPPGSVLAEELHSALRHYIIAWQLSDDAHDWQDDLKAGRVTYVVAQLLRELQIPQKDHSLKQLIPRLESQFWHHTLERLCRRMTYHTTKSRMLLAKSDLLIPNNNIEKLLERIEASTKEARHSVAKAKRFLSSYQTPTHRIE